ncbi:hypothetical protein [Actinomadura sp. 7K534]|uniref:hypothetical protein n=1 Tax=Actinomadura sp. 7K534 TaxID=2530366 RepID=UPI001053DC4C|nr:hypothetical protein [Actinomadura sp. 7K534]TDB98003.1 hypothetical protein E1266_04650 [Actinomadura sp. 7K534]
MRRTTSLAGGHRAARCRNAAVTAASGAAMVELAGAVQPGWLAAGAAAVLAALGAILDRLAEPLGEPADTENGDQGAH